MINPIFPTAYLPPIIYFATLLKFEDILIETKETFPKQTWRNRCTILSVQGSLDLSIPVVKPDGNKTKTSEIQIDTTQKWQNNHWRAIESAYNKSPYFFYCSDDVRSLIYNNEISLLRYNDAFLHYMLHFFKIETTVSFTQEYIPLSQPGDLRKQLQPKKDTFIPLTIFPVYYQVFSDRLPFHPNLSILDLAVNEGRSGLDYLKELSKCIKIEL